MAAFFLPATHTATLATHAPSSLSHPNVCTILAARAWPPEYYLLFPFMARCPAGGCQHTSLPARTHTDTLTSPALHSQEHGAMGDLIHTHGWRPSWQVS